MGLKKILLIEGNRDFHKKTRELIAQKNLPIEIISAYNEKEAVRFFNENERLDAVVLSVCLEEWYEDNPDTRGLARRLVEAHSGVIIIAMAVFLEIQKEFLTLGCHYSVEKKEGILLKKLLEVFLIQ